MLFGESTAIVRFYTLSVSAEKYPVTFSSMDCAFLISLGANARVVAPLWRRWCAAQRMAVPATAAVTATKETAMSAPQGANMDRDSAAMVLTALDPVQPRIPCRFALQVHASYLNYNYIAQHERELELQAPFELGLRGICMTMTMAFKTTTTERDARC